MIDENPTRWKEKFTGELKSTGLVSRRAQPEMTFNQVTTGEPVLDMLSFNAGNTANYYTASSLTP